MADKTPRPSREQIVLEYLSGGVTYRQLEAKYGIDHAHIQRWVMIHQGKPRDRAKEYTSKKKINSTLTPHPAPEPPRHQSTLRKPNSVGNSKRLN